MSEERYPHLAAGTRVHLNSITTSGHTGPGTVVSCEGSGPYADLKLQLDQCEPGKLSGCVRAEVKVEGEEDWAENPTIDDYKREVRHLRWLIDYYREISERSKAVIMAFPYPGFDKEPDDYQNLLNELDVAIGLGRSEGQEMPTPGGPYFRGADVPKLPCLENPKPAEV